MKKSVKLLLLIAQVFLLLLGSINPVFAEPSRLNYELLPVLQVADAFTFKDLGYEERIMVGPYDLTTLRFSVPNTWQLTSGTINLRFTTGGIFSGDAVSLGGWAGGLIYVYFNDVLIETILLDQMGDATREIQIPAGAMEPVTDDGRHVLSFLFDATFTCDYEDFQETLIINSDSDIRLQHQAKAPSVDLSTFPLPLYQPNSPINTNLTLVVPDEPSDIELQAALTVSAGLGYIIGDGVEINMVSISNLSEEILNTNNLILIGLPTKLPILSNVTFPFPVAGDAFVIDGSSADDGIIQIAVSPWNPSNVALLLSGNTENGVVKAAQVLGTGVVVPSGRQDISVISEVNPENTVSVLENRTLGDLGYENEIMSGGVGQFLTYYFYASPEQAISTGAYIDLVTLHSDLLDYEKSGLMLLLNDQVIGSIRFDKDSEQLSTTRLKLLPQVLNQGINRLEIIGDLKPTYNCFSTDIQSSWVTISASTLIHLPNNPQEVNIGNNLDLQNYSYTFPTSENLKDLAFILSRNDPSSWGFASKLANYFGKNSRITVVDLRASFADDVSEEILQDRSLIIIGRASNLPIIDQLGDALPAPFEPGTDAAIQPAMLVNYRLLADVDVGYIQLLQSPWNSKKAVLAVMGNSDQGISFSTNVLTDDTLLAQLRGDFSILYGDQILSVDTRLLGLSSGGDLAGNLPPATMATNPTPSSSLPGEQEVELSVQTKWILPTVFVSTTVVLVTVAIILWRKRAGRLQIQKHNDNNSVDKEP
jgi:cellulose synthase operon protein B